MHSDFVNLDHYYNNFANLHIFNLIDMTDFGAYSVTSSCFSIFHSEVIISIVVIFSIWS